MTATIANVEMAQAWNGPEGDDWARDWERYDTGVRGYHLRLLEACRIQPGERVLDIGCGNGEVARDLVRQGARALGIDLSHQMIAKARELAHGTADYVEGDAEVHPFEADAYDVVVSRFGAMFFADRRAAFANLVRALKPGGRLVILTWQDLAANEWLQVIRGALAAGRDLPVPPVGAPSPFGLADTEAVLTMLRDLGLTAVRVEPVIEAFDAGADGEDAMRFLGSTGVVRGLTESLPPAEAQAARDRLLAALVAHETSGRVVLGSACWLYTAVKPD